VTIVVNISNSIISSGGEDKGVGRTYHLQAVVDGRLYVQTMEARILRSNVYVLSRKSALPQCYPDLFLIAVHLSGICPSRCILPVSQSVSQSRGFQEIEVLVLVSYEYKYKRTDMAESHGQCLVDLVYWTLSVTEGPRAERDTRNSVA
jgi:hypothetical protein